jgi:hypothetical protein
LEADVATFLVIPRGPWDQERNMFHEKKDLLELALERPVRVLE